MKIEHKTFETEVKAFDDTNLIVEHFISTEHKDRGGDIMRAKGMKIVGKPVVLMLHGRGPMASEPIAKPLSITVDEFKGQPGILAKTQFFPDEVGTRLYQKIKGGYLPNWSIGYSVDEAKDIFDSGKYAGRDVTKWQLFEYSPVGVPMNPFAQTVKEFLDADDAGKRPEIKEESRWFGIVEEKTCTGCGACGKKHPCPTCKGDLMLFVKDGNNIGIACEKCQPEEFVRLQKEIAEKAPADDMPARMTAMEEQMAEMKDMVTACDEMCMKCEAAMQAMADAMKKFEPLLKTLPPEPEGGDKGKGSDGNPPEPKRLVFHDSRKDEREQEEAAKAQRRVVVETVRSHLHAATSQQADKLLGKVH